VAGVAAAIRVAPAGTTLARLSRCARERDPDRLAEPPALSFWASCSEAARARGRARHTYRDHTRELAHTFLMHNQPHTARISAQEKARLTPHTRLLCSHHDPTTRAPYFTHTHLRPCACTFTLNSSSAHRMGGRAPSRGFSPTHAATARPTHHPRRDGAVVSNGAPHRTGTRAKGRHRAPGRMAACSQAGLASTLSVVPGPRLDGPFEQMGAQAAAGPAHACPRYFARPRESVHQRMAPAA